MESVDDVAEWSNLLRGTPGAGFRHQSSGVGSNPTIITLLPQWTDWRNGSASDSRPEGYVFESRIGQSATVHQRRYFAKVRRLLAPGGFLIVISCNRIEGVGGPSLACVAEARGWNVVTSFAQNEVVDVVVYEPRPGPTPPAPLPPPPAPDQGPFAQRNLRLRIAAQEYCPAWPDDEDEDTGLPGWVEGDSLAPYVGSDSSLLVEALAFAWLTPLDVVCDVGCGDGRFVTMAVACLGAQYASGLEIDAALGERAADLARRRGVAHRTTFLQCDCSRPSAEALKLLDDATLLVMYLLPEALETVRPIIDRHLSGPMLGYAPAS